MALEQRRFFGPLDILVLQHRHLGDLALIGDLIAPNDSIRRDGVGDTIPQGFDAQHPVLVSLCMGSDGKKHLRQIGSDQSDTPLLLSVHNEAAPPQDIH